MLGKERMRVGEAAGMTRRQRPAFVLSSGGVASQRLTRVTGPFNAKSEGAASLLRRTP